MKRIVLSLLVLGFFAVSANSQNVNVSESYNVPYQGSYTPSFKCDGSSKRPKNVILLIGDGMGLAQLSAGMYANCKELTITNLKTCGFVRTQSGSSFTTDSAASGTAYATGNKTHNGAVGVDYNDNNLSDIPEIIASYGYVSGVVSTDPASGATPASFFAHRSGRGDSAGIWADLANSPLSFIATGSKEEFESQCEQTRNAVSSTFDVVNEIDPSVFSSSSRLACFPPEEVVAQYSGDFKRGDFLPVATESALNFLSSRSKKGFFLMVEGAHIDHNCHGNNIDGTIREVLDFDKAVEAAVRFAEKDGNTLVIVSADHETGMLSLDYCEADGNGSYFKALYASYGHSPIMVPLFAYGPSSRMFSGVQENSDVGAKIIRLLSGKR